MLQFLHPSLLNTVKQEFLRILNFAVFMNFEIYSLQYVVQ